MLLILFFPCFVLFKTSRHIFTEVVSAPITTVAIVFGAGLNALGGPSDVLQDRLTVAADLYYQGKIQTILVSGDNRVEGYNEPQVMFETLTEDFYIPIEDVKIDYAGRRTYDTCARAKSIWGVDHALLVTQAYHLPRALWTCTTLGIESQGVSATLQPYLKDLWFRVRELGALYQMAFDLYFSSPSFIGGDPIIDLDL
ncbi:MAG: hypothetical protein UX57_C0004G0133 [Candidatus Uhrbacteria bacterium GW2011_GWE2_46_68]|uniref:DUF218 domain-containing protein n=2 Tax=Candidatus Uhriibacteriota TaxID=1752732 RepID=A0A0G1Q8V3_9BACT|nr:MAG: hypothetical protein UX45_C0001G0007 [Candidatus Uhrbacteria bacterium GW2011_GWF2_46_218]KKU41429.1 MAG: hypothetical protein UX57_C0004G0133 [Candidatus Uhrbacteria bacterium GW2011_GWE2_46_68]